MFQKSQSLLKLFTGSQQDSFWDYYRAPGKDLQEETEEKLWNKSSFWPQLQQCAFYLPSPLHYCTNVKETCQGDSSSLHKPTNFSLFSTVIPSIFTTMWSIAFLLVALKSVDQLVADTVHVMERIMENITHVWFYLNRVFQPPYTKRSRWQEHATTRAKDQHEWPLCSTWFTVAVMFSFLKLRVGDIGYIN